MRTLLKKGLGLFLIGLLSVQLIACNKQETSNNKTSKETTDINKEQNMTNNMDKQNETDDSNSTDDSKNKFPLVINTMGIDVTFEKEPERVFPLDYCVAELFVALGLEDKIVKMTPGDYTISDVLPEHRDAFKNIDILEGVENGIPPFETVLRANPDLVYGTAYSFYPYNCGEASGYLEQGINVYANEGTFAEDASIENTYNDIKNIGKIFSVEDRAEKLIKEMQEKIASVKAVTDNLEPVNVVVVDGLGETGENLFTIGGGGLENKILADAGAKNLFDYVPEHYFAFSFEDFINKNPDVIVIFEQRDEEKKIDFLKNKPEFADISAVKNNKFVVVSSCSVFPSIQNADAVVNLAKALHPDKF